MDQNVQEDDGSSSPSSAGPRHDPVAAALAAKTGARSSRSRPLPDGRYLVTYEEPVFFESTGDRTADVARFTQGSPRESRPDPRDPEQWLWIHRRWKTQPKAGA
jgi:lauroyl/myristoyl acyltransferase